MTSHVKNLTFGYIRFIRNKFHQMRNMQAKVTHTIDKFVNTQSWESMQLNRRRFSIEKKSFLAYSLTHRVIRLAPNRH